MPAYGLSKQRIVAGTAPGEATTRADIANISTDVGLDNWIKPMGMIPAVDATNGPWTADTGFVAGVPAGFPNVSGKTFYAWNSGVFNTQSQNWQAVPTGAGQNTSGYSACMNASTPRVWTFGSMTGYPLESLIDFSFVTDSTTVTLVYNALIANQGGSTTHHDHTVFYEHQGQMKELGTLPKTGTGGSGLFYRTLTVKEARMAEWRFILPGMHWLIGIIVDSGATVRKAPNKFLFAYNGDSWGEAMGCTLASPIGGAWPTGTYRTAFLPTWLIRLTGGAVIQMGQGGTGEFNANNSAATAANVTNSDGSSVFHGVSRINHLVTNFGSRNPVVLTLGGWNDGTLPAAPVAATYQTRVQEGIQRFIAAKSDIKLLYASIEPVSITGGDSRDLSLQGQLAAFAAGKAVYPGNVLSYADLRAMWVDTSTAATSQRTANVNTTDTIHLHIKGGLTVANWLVAWLKNVKISASYVNAMMTWGQV
jgi:hypothetical protein